MNTTEMKELLKEKERAEAKAETITQREEEAMKRLLDRDGGSLVSCLFVTKIRSICHSWTRPSVAGL